MWTYLTAPCYNDSERVPKCREEELRMATLTALERLRKSVRDFLFFNWVKNLKFVYPLLLMSGPCKPKSILSEPTSLSVLRCTCPTR